MISYKDEENNNNDTNINEMIMTVMIFNYDNDIEKYYCSNENKRLQVRKENYIHTVHALTLLYEYISRYFVFEKNTPSR